MITEVDPGMEEFGKKVRGVPGTEDAVHPAPPPEPEPIPKEPPPPQPPISEAQQAVNKAKAILQAQREAQKAKAKKEIGGDESKNEFRPAREVGSAPPESARRLGEQPPEDLRQIGRRIPPMGSLTSSRSPHDAARGGAPSDPVSVQPDPNRQGHNQLIQPRPADGLSAYDRAIHGSPAFSVEKHRHQYGDSYTYNGPFAVTQTDTAELTVGDGYIWAGNSANAFCHWTATNADITRTVNASAFAAGDFILWMKIWVELTTGYFVSGSIMPTLMTTTNENAYVQPIQDTDYIMLPLASFAVYADGGAKKVKNIIQRRQGSDILVYVLAVTGTNSTVYVCSLGWHITSAWAGNLNDHAF